MPALPKRISFSKSSVIPAIFAPPLSRPVAITRLTFKKLALPHVVLKKGGFSVIELTSLAETNVLYAPIEVMLVAPSLKIFVAKKSFLLEEEAYVVSVALERL